MSRVPVFPPPRVSLSLSKNFKLRSNAEESGNLERGRCFSALVGRSCDIRIAYMRNTCHFPLDLQGKVKRTSQSILLSCPAHLINCLNAGLNKGSAILLAMRSNTTPVALLSLRAKQRPFEKRHACVGGGPEYRVY